MRDLTDEPIDLEGAIRLSQLCRLLKTNERTIRTRVHEGTFPVPPLKGIDKVMRFWGPAIKRWLDEDSGAVPKEQTK